MPKIIVKNLQKKFGDLEVLKDINLEVEEGEVVCVIGPSGSGKSTMLRCLNGLEEATSGTIVVDGNEITDPNVDIDLVRRNIGMVFQQFNLFTSCSTASGCSTRLTPSRDSSPVDSSSVWPSPAPSK